MKFIVVTEVSKIEVPAGWFAVEVLTVTHVTLAIIATIAVLRQIRVVPQRSRNRLAQVWLVPLAGPMWALWKLNSVAEPPLL